MADYDKSAWAVDRKLKFCLVNQKDPFMLIVI